MGPCQKVEDPGAAGWAYICIVLCCNYYGYLATLSAPNYNTISLHCLYNMTYQHIIK